MLAIEKLSELLKELRDITEDYFPKTAITLHYDSIPDVKEAEHAYGLTISNDHFHCHVDADVLEDVEKEMASTMKAQIKSAADSVEYYAERLKESQIEFDLITKSNRSPLEELARLDLGEENGEST